GAHQRRARPRGRFGATLRRLDRARSSLLSRDAAPSLDHRPLQPAGRVLLGFAYECRRDRALGPFLTLVSLVLRQTTLILLQFFYSLASRPCPSPCRASRWDFWSDKPLILLGNGI